jgi:uncharacterized OB-fold protein
MTVPISVNLHALLTRFVRICRTRIGSRRTHAGRSGAIEHFQASGRGHIYTYTVTHQNGVPPFSQALPYVLAYVDLVEGPRLMTNIVGSAPEDVEIGRAVEIDFADVAPSDPPRDDEAFAVPRFRLA